MAGRTSAVSNVDHLAHAKQFSAPIYFETSRVLRLNELNLTASLSLLSVGWQQCSVHRTGGVSQRHRCAALCSYELC